MTDLKFELLGILYRNSMHIENRRTLLHLHPDLTCQIEDALRDLSAEGLLQPRDGETSYELVVKGRIAYEEELLHKKNLAKEHRHFVINLVLNIISLVIACSAAVIALVELCAK